MNIMIYEEWYKILSEGEASEFGGSDILEFYDRSWDIQPKMDADEWSDKYRMLPQKASAEYGKMSLKRTPYLIEIMKCLSASSNVQEVAFMKAARVGGSEAGFSWLGYCIHQSPANILYLCPSGEFAKKISKISITPLLDETPILKKLCDQLKDKDKSDNITNKSFPNGELFIANATGANLRGLTCKYVYLDEVDAYPLEVITNNESEGDVCILAKNRANTYGYSKKVYYVSTPTTWGSSRISELFEKGDQRYWYMPCPHCNQYINLKFMYLKWQQDKPETVFYECQECGGKIYEKKHKEQMLSAGKWIAHNPGAERGLFASFHLSALNAPYPWKTWDDIAAQYDEANKGKNQIKLKTFVQTVLGEVWKEKGEVPSWEALYRRRENWKSETCPIGSLFLVAGLDIQKDRVAIELKTFGRNLQSWSILYTEVWGSTEGEDVYKEVEKILDKQYPIEGTNITLPVKLAAVDTRYNTGIIYSWCRRKGRPLIAIKGTDSDNYVVSIPTKVDVNERGKRIYGSLKLWSIGTGLVKPELFAFLNQESSLDGKSYPHGYVHFPSDRDEEYFKMLCSEELMSNIDRRTGRLKYEWVKTRSKNEALDTSIYCRGAASILGIDRMNSDKYDRLEEKIYGRILSNPMENTVPNDETSKDLQEDQLNLKSIELPDNSEEAPTKPTRQKRKRTNNPPRFFDWSARR